jgi:hypothetical protein
MRQSRPYLVSVSKDMYVENYTCEMGTLVTCDNITYFILLPFQLGNDVEPSDGEKNAKIWQQTSVMSDVSKSTDF